MANAAGNALSKFLQKSQNKENKLPAENGEIFYCLQNSIATISIARLSFSLILLHLHQVLICGI